jgi:DNA-binding beta-propeller fold protein YncE
MRRRRRAAGGGAGITAAAALVVTLGLAGCREEGKALRVERRVRLPASASPAASLRMDGLGREWVVDGSSATVVDTGRAPRVSRISAGPGTPIAAPLWDPAGRLYADSARRALAEMAERTGVKAPSLRLSGPVARDPRGRWIYATIRHAGVVGITADSLHTLWGWPHAGPAATALAVSPLADRVYLALDSSAVEGTDPRVQVRDQQSGRVLATLAQPAAVRWLAAARSGALFGYAEAGGRGSVVALGHVVGGLEERWRVSLRRVGLGSPAAVRVSPAGDRVAVFGRRGGGVRLLDGATGAVIGHEDESPLDVAFDAGGRLHLLYPSRTETIP